MWTLYFRRPPGRPDSHVSLTSVTQTFGGPAVIPEPGGFVLASISCSLILGHMWVRMLLHHS